MVRDEGFPRPVVAPGPHNGPMSAQPVVLDVDTGIDDACALLLAALHPGLDLVGVTCVGGNAPLPDVVRNTLTVLEAAGRRDVPVAAGAPRPLLEEPVDARHVHGADGMGDLRLTPPTMGLDPRSAVALLRDLIDAHADSGQPLTVVPLAPMTNIALLARTHPEIFARIGRIVFMGGGAMVSNATAAAEFNVFHDPEATAIVLDACTEHSVPVTMYGLDVFYAPTVTAQEGAGLRALGTRVGDLAGGLIDFACGRFATDTATIGDAGAVAILLAPEAVRLQRLPVRVELSGTWTRGRTIVDLRDWAGDMEHDPHGPQPQGGDRGAVELERDVDDGRRRTVRIVLHVACPVPEVHDGPPPRPGPRFTQCRPRDERRAAPPTWGDRAGGWPVPAGRRQGRQPGRGRPGRWCRGHDGRLRGSGCRRRGIPKTLGG